MGLMTAVLLFQSRARVLWTISLCLAICFPLYALLLWAENMIESDHFPVVMTINVAQNPAFTVDHSQIVQVNEQTKFIEKIIWQGDKEQIYGDQMSSDEEQRGLK